MARILSVSTAVCDGYDLPTTFATLADLGVRHVEPAYIKGYVEFDETAFEDAAAVAMARMLADAGLACTAVSAHLDLGADAAADALKRRLAFAKRVGAGIVITNATTRDREDRFRATIAAVEPVAADLDMVVALENPGQGTDNLIACGADAARLMDAVGSPNIRVNYDVGNVYTYSYEDVRPETDMAAALPWAVHFHLKDIREDGEDWLFCPVGDGVIDYESVLRQLAACPDAPVGLELPLRLYRPGRVDPIRRPEPLDLAVIRDAVTRSLDFVRTRLDVPPGAAG